MKCEICRKPIREYEVLNKDYIRDSCPDWGGCVFHLKCLNEGITEAKAEEAMDMYDGQ